MALKKKTAVVVGNFDGIHLGHLYLLSRLKEEAKKRNLQPLVVSFEPHPVKVLKKSENFCLLSGAEEKREIIGKQLGLDLEILPFTYQLAQTKPEEFIEKILLQKFSAALIIAGYDWRFGKGASGDIKLLKELASRHGCEVIQEKPYRVGGKIVSSSLIRELLKKTRLKEATLYLGHPYWIKRKIQKGRGFASKLGFPTLNFHEVDDLCLPNGVYAVYCDGYPAVANLGYAPTLKGEQRLLEVHILQDGFSISSQPRISFQHFLREEMAFKSVYQLVNQIKKDIQRAKNLLLTD